MLKPPRTRPGTILLLLLLVIRRSQCMPAQAGRKSLPEVSPSCGPHPACETGRLSVELSEPQLLEAVGTL